MLTDTELRTLVKTVAHTQARLYYKSEPDTNAIVAQSLFMLILSIVTIQVTRAGVDVNMLPWIPEVIAQEMYIVGWNTEAIAEYI